MSTIEQSIDVNVPVRTAYNQWTQFEEFPRLMEGVEAALHQKSGQKSGPQVNEDFLVSF
jgi:uncharacterized membrane protein